MKDRLVDFCREHSGQLFWVARWLLFSGIAYALFLTLLFSINTAKARLEQTLRDNPLFSATTGRETWSAFPPGVQLEQVTLHSRHFAVPLTLQRIQITGELSGFFPPQPRIRIAITGLGGNLQASVTPDALTRPEVLQIEADWKGLSLPQLLNTLPIGRQNATSDGTGIGDLVQLHAGSLSGSLVGVFPVARPLNGNGTLHMTLSEAGAALALPFFRAETLEQINGQTDLRWKGETVTVEHCAIRNALIQCQLSGSLKVRPNNPAASDMRLSVALTVPPDQLRLELLPPRTRDAFQTSGQANVRISGTPAALIFGLE